ncbi:MAG: UDP-glucose dehydrogenase family protein [Candidatus Nanoarchaeia archaeon]
MKIAMFGSGYVGLVTGACLANMGHDVCCVDIDPGKIDELKQGKSPIYEPGLEDILQKNIEEERLSFTTNSEAAVKAAKVIFIAVGTPGTKRGDADLNAVWDVAASIGKNMNEYKVVVNKSTVPVGTADKVKKIVKDNLNGNYEFDVVSNPEFLKEGRAIYDFQNPDRIIVGVESEKAKKIMESIYKDVARANRPIVFTDVKSAELIKYAANAMLAARISFMNQLSHLCEKVGADIKEVSRGIGLDGRIGPRFLQAGAGYGGSCFPKDVKALISTLKEQNCPAELFEAVDSINERQKTVVVDKLKNLMDLNGTNIAVWGMAFKPKTDDIREAPSIEIIKKLQKEGAKINAFDPVAEDNAKEVLKNVNFCKKNIDTVKGCDALIVVTEWDEFRNPDFEQIKKLMNIPIVVDARNIYNPGELKELGFTYIGVGRD